MSALLALQDVLSIVTFISLSSLLGEFLSLFQQVMSPIVDALVDLFGIPERMNGVARYTPSDILRVLIVVPVFLYASYRDIKSRIVRDHVWLPLFVGGLLLLLYDLWTGSIQFLAPWVLGNLLFACILGFVLYKTHLFGGADMKALIGLGLCIPTYPALVVFPRVLPPLLPAPENAANMFALTILANTALVAIIYPLYTLAQNGRDGFDASPGLLLTARRVPLEASLDEHGKILPLWTFSGEGFIGRAVALVKAVMFGIDTQFVKEYLAWHNESTDTNISDPTDLDRVYIERFLNSDTNKRDDGDPKWETDDIEQAQEAMEKLVEQEEVWMTPGIPFIVPMTIGLLISLTVGDLVYWVVMLLN